MKLSSWAEFVGIASIVVSLVFVGYELRQNTKAVSAQAILDMAAIISDQFNLVSENADLADLILRAESGDPSDRPLSEVERFQYRFYLYNTWNVFEAAFIYYNNGLLDYSDFESWHGAMCVEYSKPRVHAEIESQSIIMLPAMIQYLDESC